MNPVAGKGRTIAAMEKCAEVFGAAGVEFVEMRTEAIGHASELAARAAADGFERVVAVGGDGTVCEVGQGLVGTGSALGIVPSGTGNDYSRCHGIPRSVPEAARLLLDGGVRTVNSMKVNEFVGLNISTMGFDSDVVRNAPRFSWLRGGSYTASVLYTVVGYKPPVMRISFDGGEPLEGTRYLVAVGCGTHYGGGMNVLPDADPEGEELSTLTMEFMKLPQDVWRLLPKFVKGRHTGSDRFTFGTAKRVVIETEKPMTLNVDGNLYDGRTRVEMEIVPKSLRVIAASDKIRGN